MSSIGHFKRSLRDLPALSPQSLEAFEAAFPRLLAFVEERLNLEGGGMPGRLEPGLDDLVKDLYGRFGTTLKAAFAFQLYDHLADEAAWIVSVLSSRGLNKTRAESLVSTWTMAIHGLVKPPEADELARPLILVREAISRIEAELIEPAEAFPADVQTLSSLAYQGKRREASDFVLSYPALGFSPDKICDVLLFPALRFIGLLWQSHKISAAEEHTATEIIRYSVFRFFDGLPKAKPLPFKALLTCVPGDEHEIGLEIMAEFLRAKGWTAVFIGRSAPAEDILAAVSASAPQVIFLSISLLAHLPEARRLITQFQDRFPFIKTILAGPAAGIAAQTFGNAGPSIAASLEDGYRLAMGMVGRHA